MTVDWNEPGLFADIAAIERDSGGVLCITARELGAGRTLRYRGDRKCRTASVIKLPVLVHIAMAVEEGELSWSDRFTLTDEEKVGGSGVLTQSNMRYLSSTRAIPRKPWAKGSKPPVRHPPASAGAGS